MSMQYDLDIDVPDPQEMPRLCIELVPQTCWYSNVRSEVSPAMWDRIRADVYAEAKNVCEICGGIGPKHPVEAHEKWDYDIETLVQTLLCLRALCSSCHEVKHFGLAQLRSRDGQALKHLQAVNGWTDAQVIQHRNEQFALFRQRSQVWWTLNLDYLARWGIFQEPLSPSMR